MAAFGWILRILLSRRSAVYLLLIMLAFLIAGSLVPDLAYMTEAELAQLSRDSPIWYYVGNTLQVQRLMSSPAFLVLPVLIFLSTAACTFRRLTLRNRKEGGFAHHVSGPASMGIEELASLLSAERWRVTVSRNALIADKGGFGFWGSIVFHAGLLLIFASVVISAQTQFNAELLLTEGFPVRLGREAFVKIYKSRGPSLLSPSRVELKKFDAFYEQDIYEKDFRATLLIDGVSHEIHVNKPADIGDFQFSLHRFGFAPSFTIRDKERKELLNATLNLVLAKGQEDSFIIPDTGYEIHARFFPDFAAEPGRIVSKTPVPKNPVFLLEVFEQGKRTGKGLIALNKTETIGGLTVTFDGLNYWADLIVSRDYGLWIFAASFGLIILGLALRFALPDKQLSASIAGGAVEINGWCKYYPAFFEDEVQRILVKIGQKK